MKELLQEKKYLVEEDNSESYESDTRLLPEQPEEAAETDETTAVLKHGFTKLLCNFMITAMLNCVPEVHSEGKSSDPDTMVKNMVIGILFSVPADLVGGVLPSIKFIGRKRMFFVFSGAGSAFLLASFLFEEGKIWVLSLALSCFGVNPSLLNLIATEYFQGKRTNLAAVFLAGRIGNVLGLAVSEVLLGLSLNLDLIVLFVLSVIFLLFTSSLPQ